MSKNKGSFIDRILFSTDDYDEKHHQAKAVSQSRRRKNVSMPNKTNKVKKTKSGLVSNIQSLFTKKKSSKGKVMKMKGGAKRKNKRSTKKRKNMRRMRKMRRTRRRRKR